MTIIPWVGVFSRDTSCLCCGTRNQSVNPGNNVSKYWWSKARGNSQKQIAILNGWTDLGNKSRKITHSL